MATTSISKSYDRTQHNNVFRVIQFHAHIKDPQESNCTVAVTHPSSLDGVSEQTHNVVPFGPRRLETFGPVEQDTLWKSKHRGQ